MCLVIKKETKEIVVKKDFIVYKKGHLYELNKKFESSLYGFEYKLGVLYKQKIKRNKKVGSFSDGIVSEWAKGHYKFELEHVHEGFHFAFFSSRINFYIGSLVKCTIPKGSIIIKDSTGLGVSNQIIINKNQ